MIERMEAQLMALQHSSRENNHQVTERSTALSRQRRREGSGTTAWKVPGPAIATIAPALRSLAVPIESVELHPRNPRVGDVEAVAASLARFGQQKPIVVQRSTRFVVAGNHLLRAARQLGWTEIAANIEELDDATASAFMLADNRTADLGTYDDALLAAILEEHAATGNLAGTGYDRDDIDELVARLLAEQERQGDPDVLPAVPAEADVYVRPGELWTLGRHRLLCGDATNPADVARLLAGATPTLLGLVSRGSERPNVLLRRRREIDLLAQGCDASCCPSPSVTGCTRSRLGRP
jgi:hypothetical protein